MYKLSRRSYAEIATPMGYLLVEVQGKSYRWGSSLRRLVSLEDNDPRGLDSRFSLGEEGPCGHSMKAASKEGGPQKIPAQLALACGHLVSRAELRKDPFVLFWAHNLWIFSSVSLDKQMLIKPIHVSLLFIKRKRGWICERSCKTKWHRENQML